MAKYLDATGLASVWAKIKALIPDGNFIVICEDDEYDPLTLIPTLTGTENYIYLVPYQDTSASVGDAVAGLAVAGQGASSGDEPASDNCYQEWIYIDSEFERIGYDVAKDTDIDNMLDEIGFTFGVATVDASTVDNTFAG